MTIFGPDASSFQGNVNWADVDVTCDFGWEKVSQGTGYTNDRWATAKPAMIARAHSDGFVPGAYHFLESYESGASQADYFAAVAGDLTGFGIAIDCEPTGTSRPTWQHLHDCAMRLRSHYPTHLIGGYIPEWYWDGTDTAVCDWLWQSHYVGGSGSPAQLYANVPGSYWNGYGGLSVAVLQFSSSAVIAGVPGTCDVSAFRGTVDAYRKLVVGGTPPLPPPPIPTWQVTMMNGLPNPLRPSNSFSADAKRAQALLNVATPTPNPLLVEDGFYGGNTTNAVKSLQSHHKLTVNGLIGQHEWSLLVTGAA